MENQSRTVLIADDEADVVEVYALALDDEYDLRKAYGGREAVEKFDDDVDVVLLDRQMPDLAGDDALEEIRAQADDVRVAMVTAVDPDFDIAEMDFDAYLTKPVDDEELCESVDELLTLSEYDDRARELFAVAEKKAALETEKTERELAASEKYHELQERSAELDASIVEAMDELDERPFEKMLEHPDDLSSRT